MPPGFRVLGEYCAAEVTTTTTKNPIDCPYRSREHTSAHQKTGMGQGGAEVESQIPK